MPVVVSLIRLSDADKAAIQGAVPDVELIDAGGWFDGEIGRAHV